MKKRYLLLTIISFAFFSCGDPCDEGYSQEVLDNGTTICLPDYIYGSIHNFELGDTYSHREFGVITKKENVWVNAENIEIIPE